jgi:hypothetical protein
MAPNSKIRSAPGSAILGNFFNAARTRAMDNPYPAGFQRQCEFGRIRRKQSIRRHADFILERGPTFRASHIARRISAVPPIRKRYGSVGQFGTCAS